MIRTISIMVGSLTPADTYGIPPNLCVRSVSPVSVISLVKLVISLSNRLHRLYMASMVLVPFHQPPCHLHTALICLGVHMPLELP